MADKCNLCYRCRYFDRYYIKGVKSFNPTPCGWCCHAAAEVRADGGCEKYAAKKKTKLHEATIRRCLSDILTELSELKKAVESDEREEL